MPYTLTSDRPLTSDVPGVAYHSRHAVTTLEEARKAARHTLEPVLPGGILPDDLGRLLNAVWSLPESGGTVGPLPDGTVIEVERVTWSDLATECGIELRWEPPIRDGDYLHAAQRGELEAVLVAWNARQQT